MAGLPRFVNNVFHGEDIQKCCIGGFHHTHIGETYKSGRYKILNKLGNGSYGTVWLARDIEAKRYVAFKITSAGNKLEQPERELYKHLAYQGSNHPGKQHLVQPLDRFMMRGLHGIHHCLVMPLLGPTVEQKAGSYVSEMLNYRVARRVATQLSESLAYMHSVGIGHGDCATRNIVFKLQGIDSLSEAEIYTIFGRPKCQFFNGICGCDLCSRMGNNIVQPIDMARINDKYISNDIVLIDYGFSFHLNKPRTWKWGMDRNFAPEIAFEGRFSKASDIWALGCIIYELFTGEPLFKGDDEKDRFLAQMVPILGVFPYQWWRWDMRSGCLGPKDFCATVSNDLPDAPKKPRSGSETDKVSLFGLDPSPHLQLSTRGAAALTDLLGSMLCYSTDRRISANQVPKDMTVRCCG
ncbi:MAG: hypothetical protein Q9215_007419 [Flavoplaca cf. flavocitrina]